MDKLNSASSSKSEVPLITFSSSLDQSFEINLNPFDATCDSIGRPSILGSETYNILHKFPHLKDLDVSGRDSLGILNLNDVLIGDCNESGNSKDLTNLLLSDNSSRDISPLNAGMCVYDSLCERKPSASSSISSFNSLCLNVPEPSRIWSTTSIERSDFNQGFLRSHLLSDSKSIFNNRIQDELNRGRILSLPATLGVVGRQYLNFCKSEGGQRDMDESLQEDNDHIFDDSVFIEAKHIASKIADGSILDNSCEDDVNILNSTPQPDFVNDSELNTSIEGKCDTETVYKAINKMFPPSQDICIGKSAEDLSNCKVSNPILTEETHLLEPNNKHVPLPSYSGSSKSTEVINILGKLSNIINSDEKDVDTKALGQNLIANLTSLLLNENSTIQTASFDSEHSSDKNLGSTEEFCYGKKRNSSQGSPLPLDMSLKNKIQDMESMSQSFDHSGSKKSAPKLENNLQKQMMKLSASLGRRHSDEVSGNVKVNKKEGSLSLSKFGIFKAKKSEGVCKKGPLKAVIPFNKIGENVGAKKEELKIGTKQTTPKGQNNPIFNSKKTSTPIDDPKILPLAQSTPDKDDINQLKSRACSSMIRNRKLTCPISPLARPVSKNSLELNKSDSLPDLNKKILMESNSNKSLNRRNLGRNSSVVHLKHEQKSEIKRSQSLGKENSLHAAGTEGRSNNTKLKNGLGMIMKNAEPRSFLQENIRRVSGMRPFNLMSTLKKSNKSVK